MTVNDRWGQQGCLVTYETKDGNYTVELRSRNNTHKGEPLYKVWVYRHDGTYATPCFQISFKPDEHGILKKKYRGYGRDKGIDPVNPRLCDISVPPHVTREAQWAWKRLLVKEYGESVLVQMRHDFIVSHGGKVGDDNDFIARPAPDRPVAVRV